MEFYDDFQSSKNKCDSWRNPESNEQSDIEYILGEVSCDSNGTLLWRDHTGYLANVEEANFLLSELKREFRAEYLEIGTKVFRPSPQTRRFIKYIKLRLNPLERNRFETTLCDYLGCTNQDIADFVLAC